MLKPLLIWGVMCAGNGVADAGLGNGNPWTVGVINFKLKRPLFLLVSLIFGTPRPIFFWGRSGVLSAQITRWHEASRFMVTTLMRQDGKGIKATEYIQVFEEKWKPYFWSSGFSANGSGKRSQVS